MSNFINDETVRENKNGYTKKDFQNFTIHKFLTNMKFQRYHLFDIGRSFSIFTKESYKFKV